MARLQAKYEHIRVTMGDQTSQSQDGGLTLTRRLHAGKRYNLLFIELIYKIQEYRKHSTFYSSHT